MSAEAVFAALKAPALNELVGNHEANVVAGGYVLAAGVAQSHDQPVHWSAAAKGAQELLLGGGAAVV
jgi:hypothetical protein